MTAVNTTTSVVTRQRIGESFTESVTFNQPQPGLRQRSADTTNSLLSIMQMSLPGLGMTLSVNDTAGPYRQIISVRRP